MRFHLCGLRNRLILMIFGASLLLRELYRPISDSEFDLKWEEEEELYQEEMEQEYENNLLRQQYQDKETEQLEIENLGNEYTELGKIEKEMEDFYQITTDEQNYNNASHTTNQEVGLDVSHVLSNDLIKELTNEITKEKNDQRPIEIDHTLDDKVIDKVVEVPGQNNVAPSNAKTSSTTELHTRPENEEEQQVRVEIANEMCYYPSTDSEKSKEIFIERQFQNYNKLARDSISKRHLIVNDKHNIIACYVPQGSSSTWRSFSEMLINESDRSDDNAGQPMWSDMENYSPSEVLFRLQNYTKFIFVRNPLERIVSIYEEHFFGGAQSGSQFRKKHGLRIQRMYREEDQVSLVGEGTTFDEFSRFLVDTAESVTEQEDYDWATLDSLCQPCLTRYDYIAKLETLEEDGNFLLSLLDVDAKWSPPSANNEEETTFFNKSMTELSTDLRGQLQQIYADDFRMFDYEFENLLLEIENR